MFLYLEFLIHTLSEMLLIDSGKVSEFGFTTSSFTGVLFITNGENDDIKKIRIIAKKNKPSK